MLEKLAPLCLLVFAACDLPDNQPADTDGPDACAGVGSVWESEACLTALMLTCREQLDQDGCWEMPVMHAGPQEVSCAWTNVAVVADPATCEISSTFGRCEAATQYWDGPYYGDGCENGELVREGTIAFVPDMELVDIADSPYTGMLYDAPLGPWSSPGTSDDSIRVCASNVAPEGPAWCDCAAAACAAIAAE